MKLSLQHNFLDYNVFSGNLAELPARSSSITINTLNQYSYCIAEEDKLYKSALQDSDVLLPDGIGIVWGAQFLTQTKLRKISGADLHQHFLEELNLKSGKCFYLGASTATLQLIKDKVEQSYPHITVGIYSPPFKPVFTSDDNQQMINAVNAFSPDVLFVGMTAPKQEKWSYEHKQQLNVGVICTIGAVFDFYAGTINRPGKFWIDNGLEWFIRLVKEPKRMAKRYLYYGPIFIFHLLKAKTKEL